MKTKTIESLAVQLYAIRQMLARFKATEESLSKELQPLLEPGKAVVAAGLEVKAQTVPAHSVPRYDVAEHVRVSITERKPGTLKGGHQT